MRPARRDASTASRLRLVRDPLDGRPRLRPVPHDKTPRPNSDSREPGSRRSIPSFSTYPGTKVIACNAITYYHLPVWPQPGSTWEQYQCQSSLFYRPSRDGRRKTSLYPLYRTLYITSYPRGRIRQSPYTAIPGIRTYPIGLDQASTRPRRLTPHYREVRTVWRSAPGHFGVSSSVTPCRPGMASHS
jgi:hypothetical protein